MLELAAALGEEEGGEASGDFAVRAVDQGRRGMGAVSAAPP